MRERVGVIIQGINNIYSVVELEQLSNLKDAHHYHCRIKGKVLSGIEEEYSPLAVGDRVLFEPYGKKEALITERLERKNSFVRYNSKRLINQTLVANMDRILLITSTDEPPFRPRFIDRAIVCAQESPVTVVLNKVDLSLTKEQEERFLLYETLGYQIFSLNAFDTERIEALKESIKGQTVALIGQSGVGKSTITNALLGDKERQKVGEISQKFQRGRHTTNYAVMIDINDSLVVDTPGMRELLIPTQEVYMVAHKFPEFRKYGDKCSFQPCTHIHEPGCAVLEQYERGTIHPDRYESYLRMVDSLNEREEQW